MSRPGLASRYRAKARPSIAFQYRVPVLGTHSETNPRHNHIASLLPSRRKDSACAHIHAHTHMHHVSRNRKTFHTPRGMATFARQLASGNVNGCTSVCCNDKPMICSTGDLCRGEAREGAEGEREAGGARLARGDDVSLKDAHGACSRVEVALPAKQGNNAVADCDASQRLTTAGPKFTVSRWHRRDGAVQAKSLGMGGQQFGRRRGFGALLNRICVGKFGGKRKSRETNRFI